MMTETAKEYAKDVIKRKIKEMIFRRYKWVILGSIGGFFLLMLPFIFMLFIVLIPSDQPQTAQSGGGQITQFGKSQIPAKYIPIYKAAAAKYGVPWNLLAAIHRVETDFSTVRPMISSVGALGPVQFMPLTWLGWSYPGSKLGNANVPRSILDDPAMIKKYGGYGVDANHDGKADPFELSDAIFTCAKYLAAHGAADGHLRQAVFAYNHSMQYVDKVMGFADRYVSGYTAVSGSTTINGKTWPLPGVHTLTSPFGYRKDPFTGATLFHDGIDISGPNVYGKPVMAFASGKVITAGIVTGYGNCIIIDDGGGISTLYGHLSKIHVTVGETVKSGQLIGNVGSTGRSTGPHLHFTIKVNGQAVNPLKYLKGFKYRFI